MKLFYKPAACSLASHITLRESGKDFTLVSVDLMKKRLENGDDYFAVNPKGQVLCIAAGRWYFADGRRSNYAVSCRQRPRPPVA